MFFKPRVLMIKQLTLYNAVYSNSVLPLHTIMLVIMKRIQ